jgi:hypothetical protein
MKQKKISRVLLPLVCSILVFSCSKQGLYETGHALAGGSSQGPTSPTAIYSTWDSSFKGTADVWNVPALTQQIMDNGTVLVYVRMGGNVSPLNYQQGSLYVNFSTTPGQISLSSSVCLAQYAYQYVIIPPSVAGPVTGTDDYQSICYRYHINQ